MDLAIYLVGCMSTAVLGYVTGRWHGYIDAQPKRDNTGRFKKKD
jgi:hypothetical protein